MSRLPPLPEAEGMLIPILLGTALWAVLWPLVALLLSFE